MPLSCCVTLSRSLSPSGLKIRSHFPVQAYKCLEGRYRVILRLTQSQEPHEQPTRCTHMPNRPPSFQPWHLSPAIRGRVVSRLGREEEAGGGGPWHIQSLPLSDPLSKAFKQSFSQYSFIETQDKGSTGPGSMACLRAPCGRTGKIWLIHRRLGRRPWGGRSFPGSSSPAHWPSSARWTRPCESSREPQ